MKWSLELDKKIALVSVNKEASIPLDEEPQRQQVMTDELLPIILLPSKFLID